jgi:hypothetical protein
VWSLAGCGLDTYIQVPRTTPVTHATPGYVQQTTRSDALSADYAEALALSLSRVWRATGTPRDVGVDAHMTLLAPLTRADRLAEPSHVAHED